MECYKHHLERIIKKLLLKFSIMKNNYILLILMVFILFACKGTYEYNTGTLPDYPVNLTDLNSEYDDYNSTSPTLGDISPLCFSSRRNNGTFDIIYKLLEVIMSRTSGKLTVGESHVSRLSDVNSMNENIGWNAVPKINTAADELGPYLIYKGPIGTNGNPRYNRYIFLYSNNQEGNQDIKFLHNMDEETYTSPKPVEYLNSSKDDAYPSFNKDFSTLYFCSNRLENFDIFKVELDNTVNLVNSLEDKTPKTIVKETTLSSDSDDKCPFVFNNLMVFTSNRPGGYGGYDLYYSLYADGKWSPPVNFGNKINTQYDEYRPITKPMGSFTNDFMIFSSNRPGGKGGFDLYYVGIDKMIKLY